ncbi:hypothetical protein BU17DRAFT_69561 [Hysterangium stoloniferum]|nr:hypothetical protein BU17DRAFT_69561 [Hysterangium stoloniferum]
MSNIQFPVETNNSSTYQPKGHYYLDHSISFGTGAGPSALAIPLPFENDTVEVWAQQNECFRRSSKFFLSPCKAPFLIPTVPTGTDFSPRTFKNPEEEEDWWTDPKMWLFDHLMSGSEDPMWTLGHHSQIDSFFEKTTFAPPFQSPASEHSPLPEVPLVGSPIPCRVTACPTSASLKSPVASSQSVGGRPAYPPSPRDKSKLSSPKPSGTRSKDSNTVITSKRLTCDDGEDSFSTGHHIKPGHTHKIAGQRKAIIKTQITPVSCRRRGVPSATILQTTDKTTNANSPHITNQHSLAIPRTTSPPTPDTNATTHHTINAPTPYTADVTSADTSRPEDTSSTDSEDDIETKLTTTPSGTTSSGHSRRSVLALTRHEFLEIKSQFLQQNITTYTVAGPVKVNGRPWQCAHRVNGVRCDYMSARKAEVMRHSLTHESPLRWMCPSVPYSFGSGGQPGDGVCLSLFSRESSSDRHGKKQCRLFKKYVPKKDTQKSGETPAILMAEGSEGVKLVKVVWSGEGAA